MANRDHHSSSFNQQKKLYNFLNCWFSRNINTLVYLYLLHLSIGEGIRYMTTATCHINFLIQSRKIGI